jgi:hypothetical protein
MPMTLGNVVLDGFEVPGGIRFGGRQALAVHRLPGGGRVIDAIGPDDFDICWCGVLSGSDAAGRARLLDGLRRGGSTVPLAWESFLVPVIIGNLQFDFASPWWIPYQIRCVVASGTIVPPPTDAADLSTMILADISAAADYTDVGDARALLGAAGATTPGSAAYASANTALDGVSVLIDNDIATASANLATTDLGRLAAYTASLANLSAARSYVARADANRSFAGQQ